MGKQWQRRTPTKQQAAPRFPKKLKPCFSRTRPDIAGAKVRTNEFSDVVKPRIRA